MQAGVTQEAERDAGREVASFEKSLGNVDYVLRIGGPLIS